MEKRGPPSVQHQPKMTSSSSQQPRSLVTLQLDGSHFSNRKDQLCITGGSSGCKFTPAVRGLFLCWKRDTENVLQQLHEAQSPCGTKQRQSSAVLDKAHGACPHHRAPALGLLVIRKVTWETCQQLSFETQKHEDPGEVVSRRKINLGFIKMKCQIPLC